MFLVDDPVSPKRKKIETTTTTTGHDNVNNNDDDYYDSIDDDTLSFCIYEYFCFLPISFSFFIY